MIYFGVFHGVAYIPNTVIMLARDVSLYDGVSMCQSDEPKKINFKDESDQTFQTLVSSRYSVALTMNTS